MFLAEESLFGKATPMTRDEKFAAAAGLHGAATANRRILFIQALPAAIGLALLAL